MLLVRVTPIFINVYSEGPSCLNILSPPHNPRHPEMMNLRHRELMEPSPSYPTRSENNRDLNTSFLSPLSTYFKETSCCLSMFFMLWKRLRARAPSRVYSFKLYYLLQVYPSTSNFHSAYLSENANSMHTSLTGLSWKVKKTVCMEPLT